MESSSLKSYCPVSNLTFISKLIETAAQTHHLAHLSQYDLLHSNQSAYRPGHSIETTVMCIQVSCQHWIVETPVSLFYLIYLWPLIPSLILDCYLS